MRHVRTFYLLFTELEEDGSPRLLSRACYARIPKEFWQWRAYNCCPWASYRLSILPCMHRIVCPVHKLCYSTHGQLFRSVRPRPPVISWIDWSSLAQNASGRQPTGNLISKWKFILSLSTEGRTSSEFSWKTTAHHHCDHHHHHQFWFIVLLQASQGVGSIGLALSERVNVTNLHFVGVCPLA